MTRLIMYSLNQVTENEQECHDKGHCHIGVHSEQRKHPVRRKRAQHYQFAVRQVYHSHDTEDE